MIKPDRPSTLRRKYRESQPPDSRTALSPSSVSTGNTQNCGHFTRFLGEGRRVSLLLRLDGGGWSLLRTLLRPNSLLTGKNTGNFANVGRPNVAVIAVRYSFC